MPVTLHRTIEPVVLDSAKVVAFKVENNVERWVEIWVAFGQIVEGSFVEHADPVTGIRVPPAYFKIEDGCHPLSPNTALRKCSACGAWCKLEIACPDCGGATVPYDGFSRLAGTLIAGGSNLHGTLAAVLYAFLLGESVPDLDTWDASPLLDAE